MIKNKILYIKIIFKILKICQNLKQTFVLQNIR